jgi:glyoxylase-like metal-dependent hydrolase (beta-lactamase superfamily II)
MSRVHRIEVPIPFPVKWVNCYYIEDSLPTLVDTPLNTPGSLEFIASFLKDRGARLEDIQRIILTHGHLDHSGLAGRIAEISGADVLVHPWDRSIITVAHAEQAERSTERFRSFLQAAGLPETLVSNLVELIISRSARMISVMSDDRPLKHGDVLPFDDFDLEAIHTPGHTAGSMCLVNRKEGTLFTGDAVYQEVTCNPLFDAANPAGSGPYRALSEHRESLELLRGLPVKSVLPGHGVPHSKHRQRIQRILADHDRRRDDIARILRETGNGDESTEFGVATRLFPGMSGIEVFYRVCAVRSHLEILEAEGHLEVSQNGSARSYRLRHAAFPYR